jgi:hypothetical protein
MNHREAASERTSHQLVPSSVIIASAILTIVALNHVVMLALPALMALDPYGLLQLSAALGCLTVVWGFLTLRRWAWTAGVILSVLGCAFPIFALQDIQAFQLQSGFHGHAVVIQFLTFLEVCSLSIFILLMQENTKSAFGERQLKSPIRNHDLPAAATQTAHG